MSMIAARAIRLGPRCFSAAAAARLDRLPDRRHHAWMRAYMVSVALLACGSSLAVASALSGCRDKDKAKAGLPPKPDQAAGAAKPDPSSAPVDRRKQAALRLRNASVGGQFGLQQLDSDE